jgi:hypothetical protein
MIGFTNFKKLAFPSSMPDNKADVKKDSRGGSVLDTNDNASNYKTLSTNKNDIESEEEVKATVKGTLKGRKSEEPPDRISYKSNRIDNSSRNEASPEYPTRNNPKIIPKNIITKEPSDKPVQNIMKVGNLFMFNVYKNGGGGTPSNNTAQYSGKETPVSNIELDHGVSEYLI